MTSVELIRSPSLTDAAPYAYAAVVPAGRTVYTAGACPLDDNGAVVAPGDVAAQAQRVMENLVVALVGVRRRAGRRRQVHGVRRVVRP